MPEKLLSNYSSQQSHLMTHTRPLERAAKLIRFYIDDTLFGHRFLTLLLFDLGLSCLLFYYCALFSPYEAVSIHTPKLLLSSLIFGLVFVSFMLGQGLYERLSRFDTVSVLRGVCIAGIIASTIALSIVYFLFYQQVGRLTIGFGTIGATTGVLTIRIILSQLLRGYPLRFSALGSSTHINKLLSELKNTNSKSFRLISVPIESPQPFDSQLVLTHLLENRVSDLVFTQSSLSDPNTVKIAAAAIQGRIRVIDEFEFYKEISNRIPIDGIPKSLVLKYGFSKRSVLASIFKRLQDIVFSGLLLLTLSPLLLLIAILIKSTSPGPVLITQPRQGRFLGSFSMFKFRTMYSFHTVANAEKFTEQNDPRITPIGRFLRPLHLDELPQLWNVLKGDMSLVGPRPETMAFAEKMQQQIPLYELRYLVRPGITGHAQINQGYARADVEETKVKLSYDLFYICHHTLLFDLSILLKTIFFLTHKSR